MLSDSLPELWTPRRRSLRLLLVPLFTLCFALVDTLMDKLSLVSVIVEDVECELSLVSAGMEDVPSEVNSSHSLLLSRDVDSVSVSVGAWYEESSSSEAPLDDRSSLAGCAKSALFRRARTAFDLGVGMCWIKPAFVNREGLLCSALRSFCLFVCGSCSSLIDSDFEKSRRLAADAAVLFRGVDVVLRAKPNKYASNLLRTTRGSFLVLSSNLSRTTRSSFLVLSPNRSWTSSLMVRERAMDVCGNPPTC
uniref:Putative secreted protein n=1 Tax=Ixodes ricinus TaxID=34613 RepID=A0A147BCR8_IXORI